mgnify:CR=1 FL=1
MQQLEIPMREFQYQSKQDVIDAAALFIHEMFQRDSYSFTSCYQVKQYLMTKLSWKDNEVFAVLFLDSQHRLIKYKEMFYGTVDSAAVYPREIVKAALSLNAAAVILAHNHPSGITTPSRADIQITQRIKQALDIIDIRTLDHIIVGEDAHSFAECGDL